MKVLFCGDRNWKDGFPIDVIVAGLDRVLDGYFVVIHGGARGADAIAGEKADDWSDIPPEVYPAEWDKYGKKAGPIRNQQMLDEGEPQAVFAFHDDLEQSKGTKDMVKRAHKAGIPVYVIRRYA